MTAASETASGGQPTKHTTDHDQQSADYAAADREWRQHVAAARQPVNGSLGPPGVYCQHPACLERFWSTVDRSDRLPVFRCTYENGDELEQRRRNLEARKIDFEERRLDRLDEARETTTDTDTEADFASFTVPFDFEAEVNRLPALVERQDDQTVLYAGRLNSIFGTPGSGKSWVSLIAIAEAVARGGHAILWDHEDTAATFKRRSLLIGFDPLTHADVFKYVRPGLERSAVAMAEAAAWLASAPSPEFSLVVIDAAESSGCPSDGGDVGPWFRSHVEPWREVGAGVLIVDHVPKAREDRPRGAIGSQAKLARVDGAALAVSGFPWTRRSGGKIFLHNHKDRGGDLTAPVDGCVAVIVGNYRTEGDRRTFGYSIEPPEPQVDAVEIGVQLLEALATRGEDGVNGQRALRGLVKQRARDVDVAVENLIAAGLVQKTPKDRGQGWRYLATPAGLAEIGADKPPPAVPF